MNYREMNLPLTKGYRLRRRDMDAEGRGGECFLIVRGGRIFERNQENVVHNGKKGR